MPRKTKLSSSSHCRKAIVSSTHRSGSGGWSWRKSVIGVAQPRAHRAPVVGDEPHLGRAASSAARRAPLRSAASRISGTWTWTKLSRGRRRPAPRPPARSAPPRRPRRARPRGSDARPGATAWPSACSSPSTGIEDEGPVRGRELDRRVCARPCAVGAGKLGDADRRRLDATAEEREGLPADRGESGGLVFDEVLAGGALEQDVGEGGERLALGLGRRGACGPPRSAFSFPSRSDCPRASPLPTGAHRARSGPAALLIPS